MPAPRRSAEHERFHAQLGLCWQKAVPHERLRRLARRGSIALTAVRLSDDPTGPECARALRAVACARDMSPVELVRIAFGVRYPEDVIPRLEHNWRVMPRTIAIVRRLVALAPGDPIPGREGPKPRFHASVPVDGFRSQRAKRQAHYAAQHLAEREALERRRAATVIAEPCFRCGVRSDVGCRHRAPATAREAAL